jgi:prophage regulatory protein
MHELNDLKRQNISEDSRLLDARQAAKMLGYSVATLYRHHGAKLIPSPLRIGGAVRWDKEELENWITEGCPDEDSWKAIKEARGRQSLGRLAHRYIPLPG